MATLLSLPLLAGCKHKAESPALANAASYFENGRDGGVESTMERVRCGFTWNDKLRALGATKYCLQSIADSVTYSYRSADGRLLVRGKQFEVAAERLDLFADSLERALSDRFGAGFLCPHGKTSYWLFTTRFHRWQRDGHTYYLKTFVVNNPPVVQLESAVGTRECESFAGAPGAPL